MMRKNVRRAQYSEYSFHHLCRIAFDFCRNLDCLSFEEILSNIRCRDLLCVAPDRPLLRGGESDR